MTVMAEVGVHQAKTHLSRLLQRVAAGEEIVITRSGRPVAKLVPVSESGSRELGLDQGRFTIPDDFNEPLPEDILQIFER
jgi:prevent-host-death family protein